MPHERRRAGPRRSADQVEGQPPPLRRQLLEPKVPARVAEAAGAAGDRADLHRRWAVEELHGDLAVRHDGRALARRLWYGRIGDRADETEVADLGAGGIGEPVVGEDLVARARTGVADVEEGVTE